MARPWSVRDCCERISGLALIGVACGRGDTDSNVKIRVCRTEDEEQNASVQDARQDVDTRDPDRCDKGGRSGRRFGAGSSLQRIAVVWNAHAEQNDAGDVEDADTPERELDGAWDVATRVLCFADSHTDQLRSEVRENGGDHALPHRCEASQGSGSHVFSEGSRVVPVAEATSISVSSS